MRLVGAAYLVWLGVQSLWAAARGYGGTQLGTAGNTPERREFIGPGDPVLLLSMAMATVHIVLGIVWLSAYAWLLDHAVEAFRGSRIRRVLDSVTGAVLVALGIRVAAD